MRFKKIRLWWTKRKAKILFARYRAIETKFFDAHPRLRRQPLSRSILFHCLPHAFHLAVDFDIQLERLRKFKIYVPAQRLTVYSPLVDSKHQRMAQTMLTLAMQE